MKSRDTLSIFQRPLFVALFALIAAIAWGFAYPLIKLGYAEFQITPVMTGSKMLFAGIRFTIAGLLVLAMARTTHKDFHVRQRADWWFILLFCLVNTTLHYTFFYIGLSHSEGSRAAILNSLSVFSSPESCRFAFSAASPAADVALACWYSALALACACDAV